MCAWVASHSCLIVLETEVQKKLDNVTEQKQAAEVLAAYFVSRHRLSSPD